MFEQQMIKPEPRSPLQNVLNDGTFTAPTHQYSASPNHQYNVSPAMRGGEMTLFPDSQQGSVPPLLSPFEMSMQFQQSNNQFNMNPTAVQRLSPSNNTPLNNFNNPPEGATNDLNNVANFSNFTNFSNRLLDLDTQQTAEEPDFSLPVLNSSLMNILCENNNADGGVEENMSDSLRLMSLDNNNDLE